MTAPAFPGASERREKVGASEHALRNVRDDLRQGLTVQLRIFR